MATGSGDGGTRHRQAVDRVQEDRGSRASRSAHRPLRTGGEVRRGPGVGRSAAPRRRGRPGELRHHRADRRHRAFRAAPQHQVRDLRDPPDQRSDHRRAPLDRLGAPLGAGQGTSRRAVVLEAGGDPPPDPDRRRGRRRPRHDRLRVPDRAPQDLLRRSGGPRRGVPGRASGRTARPSARRCPTARQGPARRSRSKRPRTR